MPERGFVVGDARGWLRVKREPGSEVVALPEYLQVETTASDAERDYFTALEGPEKGKRFSVKAGSLKAGDPGYRGPAVVRFDSTVKQLTYAGTTIPAITDTDNPVPAGTYPIQIPDFPHDLGIG